MGQVLAWNDPTTAPEAAQTTKITVLRPDGVTVLAVHDGLTGNSFDVPDASFGSEPVVILRTSSERIDADGTFESLQWFDHWVIVGIAGGAESDAGVGAFSGAGAAVRPASFSGSGSGAFSGTGLANSSGAFSGSGAGALSAVGVDGNGPDANTLFLARFRVTPPVNEATGATGTLFGNASCDTGNNQLVCDGTGDWLTFAGGSPFNVTTNWTTEFHTNQAAAQVGGTSARAPGGDQRYGFFFPGDGSIRFYCDHSGVPAFPLLATAGSLLDGNEHHVAVVRDGTTWRLYFDGVQKTSITWSGAPTNSNDDFFIGSDAQSTSSRDILGRFGRVKLSNVCRYPSGTTFTPPARTAV